MVIPYSTQWIDDEDVRCVEAVLKRPFLTQGPELRAFEGGLVSGYHQGAFLPEKVQGAYQEAQFSRKEAGSASYALGTSLEASSALESSVRAPASAQATEAPVSVQSKQDSASTQGSTSCSLQAIALSSGTAALHLSYLAMGMGPGKVGITSPVTFAASANAFLYTGADLRFVDVDPLTGTMDPDALEAVLKSIPEASRGVVTSVSLGGDVGALEQISSLCRRYGWKLVEDAAHSLGAYYKDGSQKIHLSGGCHHSDASILSFHPVKAICTGEGGAVMTRDPELADVIRRLRSHGIERPGQPEHPEWWYAQVDLGYNYRMTELQAALGRSQLKKLGHFIELRRKFARLYRDYFAQSPLLSEFLQLPPEKEGHAYHLFRIHLQDATIRDALHSRLKAEGILTQVHYTPLYRFPYYQKRGYGELLPGAEAYFKGCLSIPLFPKMRLEEHAAVCHALSKHLDAQAALVPVRLPGVVRRHWGRMTPSPLDSPA